MRLHDPNLTSDELIQMQDFNRWILDMGAGRLPTVKLPDEDDSNWITIPDDLLTPTVVDPISQVVSTIFPDVNIRNVSFIKERCILCPTNDEVDSINLHDLDKLDGEMYELLSVDEICPTTHNAEEMKVTYPPEFLNTLRFSGVPNHVLMLKIGTPVILLRNVNLDKGLSNGTRLVITQITRTLIEAEIITDTHAGELALIAL